jgi:uncharacterized protein (DUF885 family)
MKKFALILFLFLIASSPEQDTLEKIQEDYWQHQLAESVYFRMKYGLPIEKLPDPSEENMSKETAFAQTLRDRLEKIAQHDFSHQERISYEILKWNTASMLEYPSHFYLMTPVTPYGSEIPIVHRVFQNYQFSNAKDLDSYTALLRQYPAFIAKHLGIVQEQFRKGILLPKEELAQVQTFLQSYQKPAGQSIFFVKAERLAGVSETEVKTFQNEVSTVIENEINPELKKLTNFLSGEYAQRAPDKVGMAQYPGGKEAYRFLVRLHTTTNVIPEQVHQIGLEQVERINREMQKVREKLKFQGTKPEFHQFLKKDPRFYPKTAEEIGETLMRYVRRIEPHIDSYFFTKPRAPYGVKRLDPLLEGVMTFGYYQDPTRTDPVGIYYYNGSNLSERPLFTSASLIYHELVPGHHFQICLQSENELLPEFRRAEFPTAFIEGWAEYASDLAADMGMYADPYERYGRLAAEMFLTSRLVVDTGMNYLGWSRTRAAEFLKENSLLSETEIFTETLRYSTDIPGQALAYKMGSMKIRELREKTRAALKERFDIRHFHDTVLGSGAMPMAVLEQHIDHFVQQEKSK